jgi:dethiobiotin synthetase
VNYFITGTDTGVGKTYVTALLTRALRSAGLDTVALKPISCGDREDAESLRNAIGGELPLDAINPLWFDAPAAPLVAAREEGRTIERANLRDWYTALRQSRKSLLVEGVGGWLVPVAEGLGGAEFAAIFDLPVVIVVANRLGCINHTLLTIESVRTRGFTCAGLIINHLHPAETISERTNAALLRELTDVPVLFEIQPGQRTLNLAVA